MNPVEEKSLSCNLLLNQASTIIEEEMNIEPNNIGRVIGRNHSNVNRLKTTYKVGIILPPKGSSQIIIQGPAEMVFAAKKDIGDGLPSTTRFFIQKEYTDLIIGPYGREVQALSEEHDYAQITIERGDGEVVIKGTKRSCETCKKAIEFLIQRCKNAETYQEKLSVDADMIGYVAGKYGSNVRRIQSKYNVRVFLPSAQNGRDIVVKGSMPDNVYAAKKDILDCLPCTLTLDISGQSIGQSIVRRLEKEYGVSISYKMYGKKVYILGMKSRAEAARKAIISNERRKMRY